jgi:hypothetical protein
LAPGEAHDLIAEQLQRGVPRTVFLERGSCPMRLPPVDFDDHPLISPEEIHLISVDLYVHLWCWNSTATANREEALLEFRTRAVCLKAVSDRKPEEFGFAQSSSELDR